MELENQNNNIENNNMLNNEITLENKQKDFLNSTLGKTINTAVDIGIRAALPDLFEDQIIDLKDNLFNYGLKEGISKSIESAIDFGKSAIGIFTGKFDNVSQMRMAIENGGLIDSLSDVLDVVVNKTKDIGILNSTTARLLKNGKNMILNNVENNIEKMFMNQTESIKKLEKYIDNWKNYYNAQNFSEMSKVFNKIEKAYKDIAPIENTINQVKEIKNLQELLNSNGQDFNLSQEQLELAKIF